MLKQLLDIDDYEKLRKFVLDFESPKNLTKLITEMNKERISFSAELVHNELFNNINCIEQLPKEYKNVDWKCYAKLMLVYNTSPVTIKRITKILKMFEVDYEV